MQDSTGMFELILGSCLTQTHAFLISFLVILRREPWGTDRFAASSKVVFVDVALLALRVVHARIEVK